MPVDTQASHSFTFVLLLGHNLLKIGPKYSVHHISCQISEEPTFQSIFSKDTDKLLTFGNYCLLWGMCLSNWSQYQSDEVVGSSQALEAAQLWALKGPGRQRVQVVVCCHDWGRKTKQGWERHCFKGPALFICRSPASSTNAFRDSKGKTNKKDF